MNRFDESKRVYRHKIAILKLWKTETTKVSLIRVIKHDLEKMILILILGDYNASKIHRRVARHHNIKTDEDLYEAYLDWASARYTKPEMQMDAIQTAKILHPELLNKCIKHYLEVNYK
jgi:hypothetical protein